jgi:multicomponent Na+:H+ antiporter subunit B
MLVPVLLSLSLVVFWRGHQLPGGGFIAGLVASSAFALNGSLQDVPQFSLTKLIYKHGLSIGLGIVLFSGMIGLLSNQSFLQGLWLPEYSLLGLKIHLGTPLLFDFGVFITVTTFCVQTIQYYRELE